MSCRVVSCGVNQRRSWRAGTADANVNLAIAPNLHLHLRRRTCIDEPRLPIGRLLCPRLLISFSPTSPIPAADIMPHEIAWPRRGDEHYPQIRNVHVPFQPLQPLRGEELPAHAHDPTRIRGRSRIVRRSESWSRATTAAFAAFPAPSCQRRLTEAESARRRSASVPAPHPSDAVGSRPRTPDVRVWRGGTFPSGRRRS